MGSRLMLNLRDVYYRTQINGGDGTILNGDRMPGHPSYHTRTIGSSGRRRAPLDVYDPAATKGFTQTILATFGNIDSTEATYGAEDHSSEGPESVRWNPHYIGDHELAELR